MFTFSVTHHQQRARVGELSTPHGVIQTPVFVPVGTQATVKAVTPADLRSIGTTLVMTNSYHLYLRPGGEVIERLGGIRRFMNWNGPTMSDSGGFQVFSLGAGIEHGTSVFAAPASDDSKAEAWARAARLPVPREKLCLVTDEKIIFKSHLDGTLHEWTPEKSMDVQHQLGADLTIALDECTSPKHDRTYTEQSLRRTHAWEERSLKRFNEINRGKNQVLFGVIQGGPYEDLRRESARFVDQHDFFGAGIGGAMVDKPTMERVATWINTELSGQKPVHLLGIGAIEDVFMGVAHGIDIFDCADPTRIARRGALLMLPDDGGNFKNRWHMGITRNEFREDPRPVSMSCACELCRGGYSRAYINHLYWAKELLVFRLATMHNLAVMHKLFSEIREGIAGEELDRVKKRWMG